MELLETPNPSNLLEIKEVLDTELGTIHIYENIIVMEAKENVVISIKNGLFILLKVIKMVGTRPMIYISNRKNSYSVNPNDYKYLEMIPNLKGIAVVSYENTGSNTAELERLFYKKPFCNVTSLEDAKNWAAEVLHGGHYLTKSK